MKKIIPILIVIISVVLLTIFVLPKFMKDDKLNNSTPQNNVENQVDEEPREPEEKITTETDVVFFGDSITAGFLTSGYSWPSYIKENYEIGTVTNAGISDYRASTYDDPNKWLVTQVQNHINDETKYDYVIMQGGINDMLYNTPLGEISSSFEETSFDPNTFAGGLELYLSKATTSWPDAHFGYIITYYTPMYTERGLTWQISDFDNYYNLTKEILDKWNIKYLDLSDSTFTLLLDVNNSTYLPDFLHPNKAGYDLLSPYIYNFLKGLPKYSR